MVASGGQYFAGSASPRRDPLSDLSAKARSVMSLVASRLGVPKVTCAWVIDSQLPPDADERLDDSRLTVRQEVYDGLQRMGVTIVGSEEYQRLFPEGERSLAVLVPQMFSPAARQKWQRRRLEERLPSRADRGERARIQRAEDAQHAAQRAQSNAPTHPTPRPLEPALASSAPLQARSTPGPSASVVAERRERLLALLAQESHTVEQLAQALAVSVATVRNDLDALSERVERVDDVRPYRYRLRRAS